MSAYILAVDQSTQGTKGLLFDEKGLLVARADRPHRQIVNDMGWVEHDPVEILHNTYAVCGEVIEKAGIAPGDILAFGISNQRETTVAWDKTTGKPICNAIVWQCARASEICRRHEGDAEDIHRKTGIPLSPYFPAATMQWIMENVPAAKVLAEADRLALGTVDSWLVYHLGASKRCLTDYSNASRTQLFDITRLCWDDELCASFMVPKAALPEVCMSDSVFGETTLDGLLPKAIPICGVLGDSHGALFGQNCRLPGQLKATYGTGSSVMLNIGSKPILSSKGLATSLAWGANGKVEYVFEGNLNYTGAVISWLKDNVGLISHARDTGPMASIANPEDRCYFVPAFTGLGSPYWDSKATGLLTGVTRTTGRNEIIKACVECIAYQIADLFFLMKEEYGDEMSVLKVDGGPTSNEYLMQFQSDMLASHVLVPDSQELSGMGAAYMAGISAGLYDSRSIFDHVCHSAYAPKMDEAQRRDRYAGWKAAVRQVLTHG